MKRVNRNFSTLTSEEIHETLMLHVKHLYMMTEEEYQSLLHNDNVVCAMVFLDFRRIKMVDGSEYIIEIDRLEAV